MVASLYRSKHSYTMTYREELDQALFENRLKLCSEFSVMETSPYRFLPEMNTRHRTYSNPPLA